MLRTTTALKSLSSALDSRLHKCCRLARQLLDEHSFSLQPLTVLLHSADMGNSEVGHNALGELMRQLSINRLLQLRA